MGTSDTNDIRVIEKIISSPSDSKTDMIIKAIIKKSEIMDNCDFLNLTLYLANVECNQFIINVNNFKVSKNSIAIQLKDLKLKMIRGVNYLEIKKYSELNENLIVPNNLNVYQFILPKKIYNLNNNKCYEKNIAIKLKVKESDLLTSFKYEFLDLFNNPITIDSKYNFSDDFFENNKIYLFNGFYYGNDKILYASNYSSIEVIEENSIIENIDFPKDLDKIKNGEIVNLKGHIKDLNIVGFSVIMEEFISHEKIKIKIDYDLTKKINPNRECVFTDVKKESDKNFVLTTISDVYSSDETTVVFKIYDIHDKYYNRININNSNYIDIIDEKIDGNNTLQFKLDTKDKNFLFEQKFVLEKIKAINDNKGNNVIVEDSYDFFLEVNKGRINRFPCFLKKNGGFTYQLHFQSKEENLLPKKVRIKMGDDYFMEIDDFESFDNKLKKRITIINVVKQDFFDTNYKDKPFRLNIDNEENKNLKIYNIIKVKEKNNIFEKAVLNEKNDNRVFFFNLSGINDNKEYLTIKEEDKKEISLLFQKILNKDYVENNEDKNKIWILLEDKHYIDFLDKGILKYIFHNSKEEYIIMKQLLILFFYNKMPIYLFKYYIIHFEYIFPFLNKGDYLARIKVLIYFYHYYDEKNLIENPIIDIYDENNNYYKNYKPFFNAFELFFNIIDNQREGCPFYQAIHQFNGLIRSELITGLKMYSGSIISLKDIKFELIKRLNRFFFADLKSKTSSDAFFRRLVKL